MNTNLLISNVEKDVITALKERAKKNNRSVSGEIRAMLNEYLNNTPADNAQTNAAAIAAKWANKTAGRDMPKSIDILYEAKDEQNLRSERMTGFHENPQEPYDSGQGHIE